MKYALISQQQLKIIKDALDQSEIWNHCGHTLETRAQAEEILESLKPSEPEQEPVGWFAKSWQGVYVELMPEAEDAIPFYTAPPKREWVGLHLDDMPESYAGDKSFLNIAKWAEAKLKEKNGG